MSTVMQILNTVEAMSDSDDLTVSSVVSLILVEKWRHHYDENLAFEELSREDLHLVSVWLSFNGDDYSHRHQIVKDMHELFDGLSEDAIDVFLDRSGFRFIDPSLTNRVECYNPYPPLADWERELLEY